MLDGGIVEGGITLLVCIFGGIFLFGQLKQSAERNACDINTIKGMLKDYQEDMKAMISQNLADVKSMIDENKENQRDALNREISHIKDLIAMTASETREDIKRLEVRQDQANHLREKYAVLVQSVKSLHKRLDIEPPALLDDNN